MKMGFGRDGKGNGMKRGVFTLQEAYGAMRGKCEEFSVSWFGHYDGSVR